MQARQAAVNGAAEAAALEHSAVLSMATAEQDSDFEDSPVKAAKGDQLRRRAFFASDKYARKARSGFDNQSTVEAKLSTVAIAGSAMFSGKGCNMVVSWPL